MSFIDDLFQRLRTLWQLSGEIGTPRARAYMGRVQRYEQAWNAYYGKLEKPLKVKSGTPDDNVRINYARLIVDAGVAALFGDELEVKIEDDTVEAKPGDAAPQPSDAQSFLDEWWENAQMQQVMADCGINGGVCGTTFLRVFEPSADWLYPRVITVNPGVVDVETDPTDYQRVVRYILTYPKNTDGKDNGLVRLVVEPVNDARTAWQLREQTAGFGGFQDVKVTAWPYPFPPIFCAKNLPAPNEFWGMADLEPDVIDLNRAVNFVRSNTNRIIRFHAHPKTIGIGFTSPPVSTAPDEMLTINNPNAQVKNLEMQSDLTSSREFARDIEAALHEVTRTPEVVSGKLESIGQISGTALRILYRPMVEKVESKRRSYGSMLVQLVRAVLVLGGYEEDALKDIHLEWPEIIPGDPETERKIAIMDKQLGVSNDTILSKLGYNAKGESEKRATEETNIGAALLDQFDSGNA